MNFTLPTLCLGHLSLITNAAKQEYEVFRLEIAEMDIEPNLVTSETMQRVKQETAKDSGSGIAV